MTGEMSKSEVTRDSFPTYFECADLIEGATVEPFDQYQGPYILVPGRGRFFMSSDDGVSAQWYDESADELSGEFLPSLEDNGATVEFMDLIENGGQPNPAAQG